MASLETADAHQKNRFDRKAHEWLNNAAQVKGFIGFAVGQADFWERLINYRAKKITCEAAVAETVRRYLQFAGIFKRVGKPNEWRTSL